jgi:hypothetical protein
VPAAAVIPAPIAYIKVVAVKKLVVGSQLVLDGPPHGGYCLTEFTTDLSVDSLHRVSSAIRSFTLNKLECLKQASRPYNLAWNNRI